MPSAYYNEFDPYCAQWLRNLIAAGHIAPGEVDERDIRDVHPDDLRGYTQCHFFAGIGVWSAALRRAGWADDRPVWSGSCPCQPFSAAGKGLGFDDERHLWPAWHWLISECKPPVIFGEQVASKAVEPWIDLVQADMEAMDYAFGCVPFPSAGVGAPHIRDRAYWVAHTNNARSQGRKRVRERAAERAAGSRGMVGIMADANSGQFNGLSVIRGVERNGQDAGRPQGIGESESCGDVCELADSTDIGFDGRRASETCNGRDAAWLESERLCDAGKLADSASAGRGERSANTLRSGKRSEPKGLEQRSGDVRFLGRDESAGPTNGFWRDADWLSCRDEKWRPVESQPQPLVDGSAESLGLVRADVIAALTEEINATSMEAKVIGAEAMRDVFENLGAEAKRCWPSRGIPGLHEAPFLLAFVRQLAAQGWLLAQGIPLSRPEASRGELRGVRDDETVASASHRRGLDEQRAGERPDVVRVLSCILARHAQAAWGEAYKTYAAIGFPLSTGEPSRVGRLRAYGNAINLEAAAEFIAVADESD